MRISAIEIEKFANLRDLRIHGISPNLSVVYGDNESGKTSLMEFIRSSMFESRSRSRYPRTDTTDKGRISLHLDDGTPLLIERIGNRIKNVDGGPLPGEILHAMDLQTYENIFAMGLDNLMDHKKIVDDDNLKSRFLTVAGTKNLIPFRKESEKDLESLLAKRRSQNPTREIDCVMVELVKTQKKLHDLQNELNSYESLVQEIKTLENEYQKVESEWRNLRLRLLEFENAQDQRPNKETFDSKQELLESLQYSSQFPPEGLQSYSKLADDCTRKKSEYEELFQESAEIKKELESFILPPVIAHSGKIHTLMENRTRYRYYRDGRSGLQEQLVELENRRKSAIQRLGWVSLSPSEASICQDIENQARKTTDLLNGLKDELKQRETEINVLQKTIYTSEEDDVDRTEVIRSLNRLKDLNFKLKLKGQELENADERHAGIIKMSSYSAFTIFVVGLITLTLGYFVGGGIIAVAVVLGIYSYLNRSPRPSHLNEEIRSLQAETSQEAERWGLEPNRQNIDTFLEKNLSEWKSQIQKVGKNASQIALIEDHQERIEHIKGLIEDENSKWSTWISTQGFPAQTPPESIDRTIELIRSILQSTMQEQRIQKQIDEEDEFITKFCGDVSALALELGLPHHPEEGQIEILQTLLNESNELMKEMERKRDRNQQLEEKLPKVKKEIESLEKELSNLISIASDEETFKQMGKDHQQYLQLQSDLRITRNTMMASFKDERAFRKFTELINAKSQQELQIEIEDIESEIKRLYNELETLNTDKGRLQTRKEQMRTQEGLSRCAQQEEFLQTKMTRLCKRYAQIIISLYVVNKACDAFMYEKQPAVIEKSNEYLELMTSGRYRMVLDPENMEVQVHDGLESKGDGQWSSGLGDQIHLSLRLAMAEEMSARESLPIILDDVLVRFDLVRRRGAVTAIRKLATKRQVLLFTCDRHVEQLFQEVDDDDTGFLNLVDGSIETHVESLVIGP